MEFHLQRAYHKEGTNGTLFNAEKFLCHCIELPWRNNKRNISCIPEGRYKILPRYSIKFQNHLILENVQNRSLILFHPANDALKELRGCIAPVTYLNGIGRGLYSKNAMQKLVSLVNQAKDRKESIYLNVKSENHEFTKAL